MFQSCHTCNYVFRDASPLIHDFMLCSVSMPANLSPQLSTIHLAFNFPKKFYHIFAFVHCLSSGFVQGYHGFQCHCISNCSMLHPSCSKPEAAPLHIISLLISVYQDLLIVPYPASVKLFMFISFETALF